MNNTEQYRTIPNYIEITEALNSATGFDLFRIPSTIDKMLEDPNRIEQLRSQLAVDQEIEYFCINIQRVDSQIVTQRQNQGLDRNEVKVGDLVGFLNRENKNIWQGCAA